MVREVVLAIAATLLLVAPLAGAEPGQVVVALLAAALAGLAIAAGTHRAPRASLVTEHGGSAPRPRRRDRAVDPVHHPDAPRAPGRC